MEENKETKELDYEQLKRAAAQLQQRAMAAENKLRSIDFASIRLNWLFKVLENDVAFPAEFVGKCAVEIQDILTVDTEETKEETDKTE
jgi:hypothetical protein